MNYTELKTAIADWFARDDLPVDTFISLAEEEMNRTLRLQSMEAMAKSLPVNQTDNDYYYLTFPSDLLQLKHIESGGNRMEFVSNNQMNTDLGMSAYTIANELLLFAGSEVVDIYYWAKVPSLSDGAPNNTFSNDASDALLYLALDHASSYMGQPGDYRQRGIERMAELVDMDNRARYSGAPLVQRG